MKHLLYFAALVLVSSSCGTTGQLTDADGGYDNKDTLISQSLFSDRSSTISEDNIQKILTGTFWLPNQIRVAIVKIETPKKTSSYFGVRYDEDELKNRQSYQDKFSEKLTQSPRVVKLSAVPGFLVASPASFTNIREAAVRMQSDMVVVYKITGGFYTKFHFLSKQDIKAFATTQLFVMDVKTGLIPFTAISTRDFMSQKKKDEDISEARNRIQNEAVLLTINDIGQQLSDFLNKK